LFVIERIKGDDMKKLGNTFLLMLVVLSAFLFVACANAEDGREPSAEAVEADYQQEAVDWDFYNEKARQFILETARGDFEAAATLFAPEMHEAFGMAGWQEAWEESLVEAGAFIEIHSIENAIHEEFFITGVITRHENLVQGWNIVFSKDGVISGLWAGSAIPLDQLPEITTEQGTTDTEAEHVTIGTSFGQQAGFYNYAVTIGEDSDYPLSGVLSIPDEREGALPAVVVVHGSGPSDMDGNVFGNRPYMDIADFLASQGIAVLRYEKRTFAHGAVLLEAYGGHLTVWEETMEDAILAREFLARDSRIDENKIFMIGHSLGGMLAPRIQAAGGDFAGLILMATSPRDFTELIMEQLFASPISQYEMGIIDEDLREEDFAQVASIVEEIEAIEDMPIAEARETVISTLGVSAYYLQEMSLHPFSVYADKVTVPLLILQGDSDFQVLAGTDFAQLQEIFAGREDVTFRLYEGLDHLFMTTPATNFIEHAYRIVNHPGQVEEAVLQDIVDWVRAH